MTSASKRTLSLNNLMILRPKVPKNLMNLHKKFCESPPRSLVCTWSASVGDIEIFVHSNARIRPVKSSVGKRIWQQAFVLSIAS